MTVEIRILSPDDGDVLTRVAPDVFDGPVDSRWSAEFFADPRHHLVVALDAGVVVGMASAFHYVHPDKAPALFVNEVGVAPTHQRRGVGKALLAAIFAHGRALGCTEAWLGTEESNTTARALYEAAGMKADAEPFVLFTLALGAE